MSMTGGYSLSRDTQETIALIGAADEGAIGPGNGCYRGWQAWQTDVMNNGC